MTENNDRFEKVTTIVTITLFCIQVFILFIYLCSKQIGEGTPVLLWDQFGYYQNATKLYQNFSTESLQNTVRPVFSLFSVSILRFLSLPLNPRILIICNAIIFQSILLSSIIWITRLMKQNLLTAFLTASIIWAAPQFFELLSDLWGDIANAAWVFLYTALLIFIRVSEFSVVGSLFLGFVAALGFQMKPIFIFYFVISTAVFYISSFFNHRRNFLKLDFVLKIIASCGSALIAFCTTLNFIFPRKIMKLIDDLKYNNEILGYWQSKKGIYNTWLWFISVLGKNFTLPVLVLFLVATVGGVILAIHKLRQSVLNGKNFSWRNFSFNDYSQLTITFLVCLVYISFFVKTKDIRTIFFLFPLGILISVIFIDKLLYAQRRLFTVIAVILVFFHTLVILSWSSPNSILAFSNRYLDLTEKRLFTNSPNLKYFDTYQNLGIEQAIIYLEKQRINKEVLTVFLTHNSWRYNDSLFVSFYSLRKSIYPNSPSPDIGLWFKSAPFNLGGWGNDGGIPMSFFTSKYVLTVPEHPYGAFNDRKIEIYNLLTKEALANQQDEFKSGLTKVYAQKNDFDETITIYRRDRLPSPTSFVKIVTQYVKADPNNLFNVPFIYAALQIDPTVKELKYQLEFMARPEFLDSVKYHFTDPTKEEKVKQLLKTYRQNSFPEFTYDSFFGQPRF